MPILEMPETYQAPAQLIISRGEAPVLHIEDVHYVDSPAPQAEPVEEPQLPSAAAEETSQEPQTVLGQVFTILNEAGDQTDDRHSSYLEKHRFLSDYAQQL